jgi:hypothetical protein
VTARATPSVGLQQAPDTSASRFTTRHSSGSPVEHVCLKIRMRHFARRVVPRGGLGSDLRHTDANRGAVRPRKARDAGAHPTFSADSLPRRRAHA